MNLPVTSRDLEPVVLAAGGIIARHYAAPSAATRKADGSPVTLADTETNGFLRRELAGLLPAAGWLSEESKDDLERLRREWVWVVDPLDGTKEFVRRIPELAVSVGLVRQGQVVLGVVLNPITGEGASAMADGEFHSWGFTARSGAPARALSKATACVSRTEVEDGSIRACLQVVKEARVVGSVAYKLLRVAVGLEDLTFSVQPKSEWDICGGVALLAGAGKTYRRFDGRPLSFNQRDTRIRCGAAAGPAELVNSLLASLAAIEPNPP